MIKQRRQGRRPTHPSIAEPKRTLSIDSTLRSGLQAHFSAGVFLFSLASHPDEAGREGGGNGFPKIAPFPFHVSDTRSAANKSACLSDGRFVCSKTQK